MLDKSIPYFNIIMKRPSGAPLPSFTLPDGFSFCRYRSGMEAAWAEIETSVGEFDTHEDSLAYFNRTYMPYSEELERRMLFVLDEEQQPIGTITAWWNETGSRRDAAVHWFAVRPEAQGLGLGKALVAECIRIQQALEGDTAIYLHTQTWSYPAVALYLKSGFIMEEKETFSHYRNDYEQALPLLKKLLNLGN
ncbi:GNAT family N-acetyltransferase [Paenibacillus pasadenensis]|uniref:GNAT family N-acetyltransferase n=1 Tax=Paenibacillus pasadenensis TaxID=217090 RepID=UPI002040AB0D|nr:GNAT family N-acetyltransferase [Paenibacillus pasadenensis]MCM3749499.1 GNAT family N-acetyltransferase [Paenibacillus pasadenensis]